MSIDAEVVITRLITGLGKMARRKFDELPLSNSPFEISFPIQDDNPEFAESVCLGLIFGLSKEFGPSPVTAVIENYHYKVSIGR